MERTALTAPKSCFGLEQNFGNPLCTGCEHKEGCAALMQDLADRVEVDQAKFNFMPVGLADHPLAKEMEDPDAHNLKEVYSLCYEWIFDKKARGNIDKERNIILQRAKEANASLKMFMLANMLGWKQSHHGTNFYPRCLTGESAVEQVKVFASICQKQFGTFDISSIDLLTGGNIADQDFEGHLLNSETITGAWIVNYRLFKSGNMLKKFYAEKEIALHPFWLATEKSYCDTVLALEPDIPTYDQDDVIRKHRWNARRVISKLKKDTRRAILVFSTRARIMPAAIQRVLGQRGLRPEHFRIDRLPVVDSIKFWIRLAQAIQHYECLKFVDNFPSAFDNHFGRT